MVDSFRLMRDRRVRAIVILRSGQEEMRMANWNIEGNEFASCNCAYGCPCQFNARPTYGDCKAFQAIHIEKGQHGSTSLDGLRTVALLAWPGAIHEGNGEAQLIID